MLAHLFNDQPGTALGLLHASDLADPWEETVAACLTVLCQRFCGQLDEDAVHQMITGYLELPHDLTLVTVQGNLGLTVLDLLDNDSGDHASEILLCLADLAAAPGGGYTARDLLQHPSSAHLTATQRDELTDAVWAAGLGLGSVPDEALTRMLNAVEISKAAPQGRSDETPPPS